MPAYSLGDTWRLNQRVNLMLFDSLSTAQLAVVPSPRARNIADQFAHLHNVRLMWLEVQSPAAAQSLRKIEKGNVDRAALRDALDASSEAFACMLDAAERAGKIRASPRGIVAFFGYVIAHEGHHRGQIIAHLKHAGMPVDRQVGQGLWDWQKI